MPDTSLAELQRAVIAFRDERDWAQFHSPRQLAAALSIECGELQEQLLWLSDQQVTEKLASASGREGVEDELADIFAYLLCLSEACGTRLDQALLRKLEKNRSNYPPQQARGRADKYTAYRDAQDLTTTKQTNNDK